MERILSIEIEHFKNHYAGHLAAALLLSLLAPVIMGMEALNQYQAGQILDVYFSLLGIVLLTPLFMPEQNKDIRDLLASREYPLRNIQLLRLLQAVVILAVLNWGSAPFLLELIFGAPWRTVSFWGALASSLTGSRTIW